MTTEQLSQKYQDELKKLVEINDKHDFSPEGDKEFHRQSNEVYWAKCDLVNAQARESRKRAS
jgi:hypothetical protein